jgi:hypothetical protein
MAHRKTGSGTRALGSRATLAEAKAFCEQHYATRAYPLEPDHTPLQDVFEKRLLCYDDEEIAREIVKRKCLREGCSSPTPRSLRAPTLSRGSR